MSSPATRARWHGGSLLVVGNLSMLISGVVTAPLTAVALGPTGRGQVVIITLVASLLILVGSAGLGWSSRDAVAQRPRDARVWHRAALKISGFVAPIAALLAVPVGVALQLDSTAAAMSIILFAIAGLACSRAVAGNALIALGRAAHFGLANLIYTAMLVLTIVVLFVTGLLTVASAIAANALGLLVQVLVLEWLLRRAIHDTEKLAAPDESESPLHVREILRRSRPYWRAQTVDSLIARSDVIVVAMAGSAAVVGLYSIAGLVPQIGFAVFTSITQWSFSASPRLAPRRRLALLLQANSVAAIVYAAIAVPTLYLLIPTVFGEEFIASRSYLAPALAMTLALAVSVPMMQDSARRRTSWWPTGVAVACLAMGSVVALAYSVSAGVYVAAFVLLSGSVAYSVQRVGRGGLRADLRGVVGLLTPSDGKESER